jgi:hypothetical protein
MDCRDCKFCVFADNGYSNYTVEGTDVLCGSENYMVRKNFVTFDYYYGKAPTGFEQGENCVGFVEGEPISLDVDGEKYPQLPAYQKEIVDRAMS